jgi:membrane protease YdiL (CAAX protease family)
MPSSSKKQILTYLISVFLFSSIFYFLILHSGSLRAGGGLYVFGIMWCPAMAAFFTMRLNRRRLAELGWSWRGNHQWASWFIPLLYTAIAYSIVWITGLGGFPNPDFAKDAAATLGERISLAASTAIYIPLLCIYGLIGSLARALGEEIGWRGFLVPELAKNVSFTWTAIISGVVWSVWALSGPDLGRLQRGHRNVVCAHLLHCHGDCHQLRVRLDALEVRQPVDRRHAARQSQLVCAGYLYSSDP